MKKITINFLLILFSISGFAQFTQDFEASTTALPLGWTQQQNASGSAQFWRVVNTVATPPFVCQGSVAAFIDRENVGSGNTSEDYLVSQQFQMPANAELKFLSRQGTAGDQGGIYRIMVSTNPNPATLASYTLVQSYTEQQMNADFSVCQEQVVNLSAFAGQNVYLAFVKIATQTTNAIVGDRWWIDNIRVFEKCQDPTLGSSSNINATNATLTWNNVATANLWDIAIISSANVFTGVPTTSGITSTTAGVIKTYQATGLLPNTSYQYYVRQVCGPNNVSAWTGPYNFITLPLGAVCTDPIAVTALPYQTTDNTANYGDFFDTAQSTAASCGATPAATNYLAGNEVFYRYTATTTGQINIQNTPTGPNSSIFVYAGCPPTGPCLAGAANTGSGVRTIPNFAVTAGQSYTIVISSAALTQTVGYTLLIQQEQCNPPTAGTATNITLTSATLSWTNPTPTPTAWEVVVQPLGASIPTASGTTVTSLPFVASGLTAATQYQYWVRAACSTPGVFSVWAGPYPFNTLLCAPADQCAHTFTMRNTTTTGGWNGAQMDIRQNGITVATIGAGYTTGSSSSVTVQLCNGLPFEVFWRTAGTQPAQVVLSIFNSFNQNIFNKPAGQSAAGQVVYTNTVNCTTPVCTIAPINLTATAITVNTATIGWSSTANTNFDIFVVPFGSPVPTASTVPTIANTTLNPTTLTGLVADTQYTVYIRVVCSPDPSPWSTGLNFTTLPTCVRPSALTVSAITQTSASFGWTNGLPTHNAWEILLVPSLSTTPPALLPPVNPVLTPGMILVATSTASPVTISTLTAATIYYYYIRTVCPGNDKSTWAGPFVFNTVRCNLVPAEACAYRFVMSDTGLNTWNGGTMQVRQNGIVVATLSTQLANGLANNGAGFGVVLCKDINFDLVWTAAGTAPNEIGIMIVDPNGDPIFNKPAGQGAVSTTPLFTSTVNCNPPACPKPINLTAVAAQNSAQLGWTETGTATQWEVYVQPSTPTPTPPVNGSPLNNSVVPYYIANSNPFTVTNLLPQTSYTYWVRAICASPSTLSNWTLINPGPRSFFTTPVNDNCDFAVNVPVSPNNICPTSPTIGNTVGATASIPLNVTGTGCGTSDDDVWFKFIATSTTQVIRLNNISVTPTGSGVTLNHSLFSGDCTNLTLNYCSNATTSVAASLTIGQTYFIRVYTAGNTAGQSARFEICVRTPPAITNDNCANAIQTTSNNGLICTTVAAGSLTGATASGLPAIAAPCVGSPDDDVWFRFTATANNHYFSLVNIVGTSTNLNFAVYDGTCSALTLKFCSGANSTQGNNNTFVVGQTYFVRVWSNSAVREDVQFNLCIGRILPPVVVSTSQFTTQQLIENVFLGTTCATVTNITSSTGSNFGSTNGIGYFNGVGTEFPYQNGIVLMTGDALKVPGPNSTTLSDGNQAWIGDADLEAIVLAGTGTAMTSRNASILEFDFIPIKNQLSLNFLFASEEYGTFQCDFSDSFAFLLRNNATNVTTNIAVVPGTSTPVSVVTIRNNLFNTGCASVNPAFFGTFFGGALGVNNLGAPVNFNGITVPMEALASVIPGQSYHIKMVIADRNDNAFDSAIFLKGGSFDIGDIDFGGDYLQSAGNAICQGDCVTLNANIDTSLFDIKWLKNGVIIPGATSSSLQVCDAGVYKIEATFNSFSSCVLSDEITIEYFQEPTAANPKDLIFCGTASSTTFNLTENTPIVLAPFTTPHTVSYHLTAADAIANANAISNTTNYSNTVNPQTIHIRITNTTTNCKQYRSFQLKIQDLTPIFSVSGSLQVCSNGGGTVLQVVPTNNNFSLTATNVSFAWSFNGLPIAGAAASSLSISSSQAGSYTVLVNNSGCQASQTVNVTSTTAVSGTLSYSNAAYCKTNAANALPNNTYPTGGTFQSTAGLSINPSTGAITPSSSTAGPYVVNYVYPSYGGCPGFTLTTNVEITAAPISNFSYAQTAYCRTAGVASPTFATSATAGTFTATPAGLSINATSGVINIETSASGTYQVVNTIAAAGGCAATSSTATVTITTPASGTISYGTPFCKSTTIAQNVANTAPAGGVYAAGAGLSLNTTTGAIQPSTSTPNQYIVTYTLPAVGGCPVFVASTTVTIIPVSDVVLQSGCKGTQFVIEASPNGNSYNPATATFAWTGPNGQAVTPIVGQPNAIVATTQGVYTVTVTTADGCKSSQSVTTNGIACAIQKGISPNNDGKNDSFDLSSLNVKLLEIYNRYGTLVYKKENYTKEWFGQSDTGNELPDATYFYVIQKADGTAGVTGWIYVNRQY